MVIEMRQGPDGVWVKDERKPSVDLFTQIASKFFGVPTHLVTQEMKNVAKIKFYQSMYSGR